MIVFIENMIELRDQRCKSLDHGFDFLGFFDFWIFDILTVFTLTFEVIRTFRAKLSWFWFLLGRFDDVAVQIQQFCFGQIARR